MKPECRSIRDRIDCGEDSPEVREHVRVCLECSGWLAEAESLAILLREASSAPPSPDCRASVAAAISSRQVNWRPVWAVASFAVLAAAVALILNSRLSQVKPVPAAPPLATSCPVAQKVTEPALAPRHHVIRALRHAAVHRHVVRHYARRPVRIVRARPVFTEKKLSPAREDTVAPREDSPTLAAAQPTRARLTIVTWEANPDPERQSYSYTVTNHATGETTECNAERSGDKVTLTMSRKKG